MNHLFRAKLEGSMSLCDKSQLRHLDLSDCDTSGTILEDLLSSCKSLQNLSMYNLNITSKMVEKFCFQNGKTLKILDLDRCSGLDLNSIQAIVQNCVELTEANFAHTKLSKRSIDFLMKNITRKIKKLSLFGLDVSDENINVLVRRCSQLSALSLGMDFFLFGQKTSSARNNGKDWQGCLFRCPCNRLQTWSNLLFHP